MIQATLFDLDDALASTTLGLGDTLDTVLCRHNLSEKSIAEIRPYTSHGVADLLKIGVGMTAEHPDFAVWRQGCLEVYSLCYANGTTLFDGVNEMVAKLNRCGVKRGIITSKPIHFIDKLVPKPGFTIPLVVAISGDTCDEAKPSVKPMLHVCEQVHADPQHTVYVGDAERGMRVGHSVGMKAVPADWGYIAAEDQTGTRSFDHRIASPSVLPDLL